MKVFLRLSYGVISICFSRNLLFNYINWLATHFEIANPQAALNT